MAEELCAGWLIPKLIKFIKKHNLFEATFDGCDFVLVDSEGKPHCKPWRVVTLLRLAKNLNTHKCKHPHDFVHSQVAGNKTALRAYYPEARVRCIATSLYQWLSSSMITRQVINPSLNSRALFAGVHHLIDRRDWHKHVGYQQAIDKEARFNSEPDLVLR